VMFHVKQALPDVDTFPTQSLLKKAFHADLPPHL